MPSSGYWPFTLLKLGKSEFEGFSFDQQVRSANLLLFLMRTDFSIMDVKDFLRSSKELARVPLNLLPGQLDEMLITMDSDEDLELWKEKIISMCVGISIQTARNMKLCLKPVYADLIRVLSWGWDAIYWEYFVFYVRNIPPFYETPVLYITSNDFAFRMSFYF